MGDIPPRLPLPRRDFSPAPSMLPPNPRMRPGPRRRPRKQKTPQEKVDEFWKKFTTANPGKATTVIPQNRHADSAAGSIAAKPPGESAAAGAATSTAAAISVQASYEEAAALCRAKVAKIVRECRRVNQRYRDPHFDLELDLGTNRRDCLEALSQLKEDYVNRWDDDFSGDDDDVRSRGGGSRRRRRRSVSRRRRFSDSRGKKGGPHHPPLEGSSAADYRAPPEGGDGRVPGDRDAGGPFRPQSVKRVGEIFDEPRFFIEGPSAHDIRQGRDSDCWLLSALCTLGNKPGLIERVCVARDEAVGVYGFVFHRDGEWFSEIIDDKLYLTKPDYDEVNMVRILWEDRDRINSEETYRKTYQSNSGALYFASCDNPNETWLPLLEKAYAKAHGDYAAIEGGFNGEGIEDLTGGVTSELFATDILDKEYFWKEELMKVNEQFLFGCSTGVWGRGWGVRKGIYEMHAYSVMRAVELDGDGPTIRLVLLKNPWGKGEWKGAWSDGSKEWTPEWLKKLDHRFGDDGVFWISYEDLLRKYQAFDRTRLFGPDWKVTSVWTTLSIPWTLGYHDTKFAFTLTKPGPVVLVLSQLDDRYFRGLQGQYRFKLSFRVHLVGEDDYVVRSPTNYRMNRSVNVELDLDAGDYYALIKIDATRDPSLMPVEDVLRANAKDRREKLIRIGLGYDLAHRKCKVVETPEEQKAREAHERRMKEKERAAEKAKLMKIREKNHYFRARAAERRKKNIQRTRAKQMARDEMRRGEEEKQMARRGPPHMLPIRRPLPKEHEGNKLIAKDLAHLPGTHMTDPNGPPRSTNLAAEGARRERAGMKVSGSGNRQEESKHKQPSMDDGDRGQEEAEGITPVEGTEAPESHGLSNIGEGQSAPSASQPSNNTFKSPKQAGKIAGLRGSKTEDREELEIGNESDGSTGSPTSYDEDDFVDDHQPPPMHRRRGPPPLPQPHHGQGRHPPSHGFPPRGGGGSPSLRSDDGFSSVSDLSDISDRELDFFIDETKQLPPPPQQQRWRSRSRSPIDSEEETTEGDPWNAVAAIGFRVYYKISDAEKDEEVVQLRVVHPSRYDSADDDEKETKLEKDTNTALVLDLDDSAKDATLEEPAKKNIAEGEDVERAMERAGESFRTASSY